MEEIEKELEDNYNLVYSYLHSRGLDVAEWEGLVSFSLVKAIKSHDSSRGKLSTLFYRIAKNDIASARRSMGVNYLEDNDLEESVDEVDYDYLGEPDSHLLFEMEDAAGEYGWLVPYAILGYTQQEIAEQTGYSRSTISRKLSKMRNILKEEFEI